MRNCATVTVSVDDKDIYLCWEDGTVLVEVVEEPAANFACLTWAKADDGDLGDCLDVAEGDFPTVFRAFRKAVAERAAGDPKKEPSPRGTTSDEQP